MLDIKMECFNSHLFGCFLNYCDIETASCGAESNEELSTEPSWKVAGSPNRLAVTR